MDQPASREPDAREANACKIVKPHDWQFVRGDRLIVVVENARLGFSVRLYSYDGFFKVAASARTALVEGPLDILPGGVGRAVLEPCEAWGPCVLSVADRDGAEQCAMGVKLSHSEVANWLSGGLDGDAGRDGFRYPLPMVAGGLSHTGGDVTPDVPQFRTLEDLLDADPGTGPAPVGAVAMDEPRRFDGLACLSLQHSLGKDDPAFSDMLGNARWTSNVPYIARFHGAVAGVPSGMLMTDAGLWSDSTLTAFFNDPELRHHEAMFAAHDRVGTLGGARSERVLLQANDLDAFPGTPMLLSNVGYRNHAHWVMNSMLAAWYARDMIAARRVCVVVPEWSDYIVASLRSVGVPRQAIIVAPRGTYRFTGVLFPSTLSTHVNRFPPANIGLMFDAVRAHCEARARVTGPRLVYLTRQGSGAQRKISNEDRLITALKERGFAVIAPHELTFEQEVACVSGAAVVVGQLGAAMMNIAFAPRDAWIVELASHNYAAEDYWMLATALGQRFVRILTRAPSDDRLTLTDFSFEIPLEATLRSIDRVCAAALGDLRATA